MLWLLEQKKKLLSDNKVRIFYHSELFCKTSELLTCSPVLPSSVIFNKPCRAPCSYIRVVFVLFIHRLSLLPQGYVWTAAPGLQFGKTENTSESTAGRQKHSEAILTPPGWVLGGPKASLTLLISCSPLVALLPSYRQHEKDISVPRGSWVWVQELLHLSHAGSGLQAVGSTASSFWERNPSFPWCQGIETCWIPWSIEPYAGYCPCFRIQPCGSYNNMHTHTAFWEENISMQISTLDSVCRIQCVHMAVVYLTF